MRKSVAGQNNLIFKIMKYCFRYIVAKCAGAEMGHFSKRVLSLTIVFVGPPPNDRERALDAFQTLLNLT